MKRTKRTYLAYIPRADGTQPVGTEDQTIFESAGDRWALDMAFRRLGTRNCVLLRIGTLYDQSTEVTLYDYRQGPGWPHPVPRAEYPRVVVIEGQPSWVAMDGGCDG